MDRKHDEATLTISRQVRHLVILLDIIIFI